MSLENDFANERTRLVAMAYAKGQDSADIHRIFGTPLEVLSAWKKDVKFQAFVDEYTAEIADNIRRKLLNTANTAITELGNFLGNPDVEERYELAAIDLILKLYFANSVDSTALQRLEKVGLTKETVNTIKERILFDKPGK